MPYVKRIEAFIIDDMRLAFKKSGTYFTKKGAYKELAWFMIHEKYGQLQNWYYCTKNSVGPWTVAKRLARWLEWKDGLDIKTEILPHQCLELTRVDEVTYHSDSKADVRFACVVCGITWVVNDFVVDIFSE